MLVIKGMAGITPEVNLMIKRKITRHARELSTLALKPKENELNPSKLK